MKTWITILFAAGTLTWSNLAFCGEIHDAVKKGDLEKINTLLNENPDLASSKDYGGQTPLHWAAMRANKGVTELLLKYKADVNAKNNGGDTPLHIAVVHGGLEIVELLLANNAGINAENHNGWTPLDNASGNVAELLHQHGGKNIGTATNSGEFFQAARYGNLETAEALLKGNPNLALMKADNGWTALDYASFYNHTNVAKLLLDNKADVNATNDKGETPLGWAVQLGHKHMVELLLTYKANINVKGGTLLHSAALNNRKDVAEILLANKAELLDARDDSGRTPLFLAACGNHKEVTQLLLANKAEVDAKDKAGWTPLYCAAFSGRKDMVELLLANGADVNTKDNNGWTPLYTVVRNIHIMGADESTRQALEDMAELLRQHGGHE